MFMNIEYRPMNIESSHIKMVLFVARWADDCIS